MTEWKRYMNVNGELEFPKYLYKMLTDLMKTTLDLGTLVCSDPVKLRAFKEQVKTAHNQRWEDIASAFEYFDVVEPCVCNPADFCKICGGSRYITSDVMSVDQVQNLFSATRFQDPELTEKLRKGMEKALEDVQNHRIQFGVQNG